MLSIIEPPHTEQELIKRANDLAGYTLGQIAQQLNLSVPSHLYSNKGWVGQLVELQLGANSAGKPQPDFVDLGIELKTLPINAQGIPKESTFVCVVDLLTIGGSRWESSHVRRKLSRVLWVPIYREKCTPVSEWQVGTPLLWSPSLGEEAILRADWEELTELIALGKLSQISSKQGIYLQIRPKAADAKSLSLSVDESGGHSLTLPRGFYLRATFTAEILKKEFGH